MNNDIHSALFGFLSPNETASLLSVTPRTLTNWSQRGIGPKRYRLGMRCARYRLDEVLAYARSRGVE